MAAIINHVEGYLLYQAELRTARSEGEAFARRMPWLTTAQQEEVARLYAEDRLELSKTALKAITARCEELKEEYTARYEHLRQRLMRISTATLITSASLCASTWLLTR
ncbi:hypothetical protein [Streptomyces sp. NPDC000229]|uniref:hypothetical protein n=1 Tax=Streptomyces sp. NPDC000229 TaxID=3154247 RepID=UPI0033333985